MLNIFEQPWTLIVLAIVVFIIMSIMRTFLKNKRFWWHLIIPALLVIVAFSLDIFITTDSENINAIIDKGLQAMTNQDINTIDSILSADYHDSFHYNKKHLMSRCQMVLSEPVFKKNIKSIISIEISPPKAAVVLTVRSVFNPQSLVGQNMKELMTKSELQFQKTSSGQWLITRAEITHIKGQPAKWKDISIPNWQF